jgi:hypothetical protein
LAGQGGEGRRILMRFDAGSELGFLFGKHANDASGHFVMDNCLVVFSDDVNAKFLLQEISEHSKREGRDETYDNVTGLELERL